MDILTGIIESIKSVNWAISLLAAIPLSVIANLITPWFSNWLASKSKEKSEIRILDLETELQETQKFSEDMNLLNNETTITLFRVLISIALGSFTVSILSPLFFAQPVGAIFFLDAMRRAKKHIALINRCNSIECFTDDVELQISNLKNKL